MSLFKERRAPATKVEVIKSIGLMVGIQSEALMKMQVYTEECSDEIGWLGTAYYDKESNIMEIRDVFLFDQEVHATTTEITPEGLAEFAEELLLLGDEGIEIWNNLKVWGHSHVNMGVTPSAQDNSQMETFKDNGHDWFIRIITNKKGELKLDIYNYEEGLTYLDVPWVAISPKDEIEIVKQIQLLEAQLDSMRDEKIQTVSNIITEEMKVKVRKKTYATTKTSAATAAWQQRLASTTPKTTSTVKGTDYGSIIEPSYANYYSTIQNQADVRANIGITTMVAIASLDKPDKSDVEDILYAHGHDEYYSDFQLELILQTAIKSYGNNKGGK